MPSGVRRRRRLLVAAVSCLVRSSSARLAPPATSRARGVASGAAGRGGRRVFVDRLGVRGGSYDGGEVYEDDWSGDAYVHGDRYDYGAAGAPIDGPRKRDLDLGGLGGLVPDRKTGLIMCAAGAASTMLGVSLFFEKNLIRLGNVLLVAGAPIVVGPARASRYVLNPAKLRGTLCFAAGFLLVLSGHPLLGIVVEVFGFLNLFGNLFPLFTAMFKNLPFVQGLSSGNGSGPPTFNAAGVADAVGAAAGAWTNDLGHGDRDY